MASSNYRRVSRKRVCRVCGKSDWCSFTPDEKTTFCARITRDADRVSRTGWGVFYHEKFLFPVEPFPCPRRKPPKRKVELAPIEIRNFAYRKLIELAPATDSKEIIDGEKGLRARKILDFENYGALPQTGNERRELAKEIRRSINREFPDFVRKQKSSVGGLPGFWLDKNGNVGLWSEKDYSCPMMIIPYCDAQGLVQACQIRFMCRSSAANDGVRYVWLSTPDKTEGNLGCGSPLHFAAYNLNRFDKPLLITEGALKAETVRIFKGEYDVLASAGVTCSHAGIVASARRRPLLIAFDADYYENLHVARAVARLLDCLQSDAVKLKFRLRVEILTWKPAYKGIDDAFLQNVSIIPKSPLDWLKSLSANCRREAASFLPMLN
jgi:hypothetical protein